MEIRSGLLATPSSVYKGCRICFLSYSNAISVTYICHSVTDTYICHSVTYICHSRTSRAFGRRPSQRKMLECQTVNLMGDRPAESLRNKSHAHCQSQTPSRALTHVVSTETPPQTLGYTNSSSARLQPHPPCLSSSPMLVFINESSDAGSIDESSGLPSADHRHPSPPCIQLSPTA